MDYYFDHSGNAFQIDDEGILRKKETITVTNVDGEEFELDADKADEYKLTPVESHRVMSALQDQVAKLGRRLGACLVFDPVGPFHTGAGDWTRYPVGCPVIDPVQHQTLAGTGGQRGCPVIDPVPIDTVRGSYFAHRAALFNSQIGALLGRLLDSCPNIDPVRLGTIMGSLVQREMKNPTE